MLPYRDSKLTKIALGIFFVIILGYAYFEARGLLFGPSITVPSTIQEVHDPFIVIKGRADRISELRMNGKTVAVTENGGFEEPYLLAPGLNRIILDATDKYGRERQEVIQILSIPSPPQTSPTDTATTTVSTSTTGIAPRE